jgi:hypothetical protein
MEKLFDHTLQRQVAMQTKEVADLRAQVAAQNSQMGRLAELLEKQLTLATPNTQRLVETRIENAAQVNTGPVTTNITNTIQVAQIAQIAQMINIVPWDGGKRIDVSTAQIAAAFAENARLKEYVRLGDHELTDPEIAPPYVTELLMDLTKRAHADPSARNVYLNPKRADQALVHMASGRWEVMALVEATRLIFDGVAKAMVRVTMSDEERRRLPSEAQNALAMAGLLYDDEPEEYAKRAKAPMAAHLTNCQADAAPTAPQIGQ